MAAEKSAYIISPGLNALNGIFSPKASSIIVSGPTTKVINNNELANNIFYKDNIQKELQ